MIDYTKMINNFGYNALTTQGVRPDNTLMVDTAERRESIPVLLFTDYHTTQGKPSIPSLDNYSNEQVTANLEGITYSEDLFPTDGFYLGSATRGVI